MSFMRHRPWLPSICLFVAVAACDSRYGVIQQHERLAAPGEFAAPPTDIDVPKGEQSGELNVEYKDNAFQSAARNPVSTFSVDVDSASYNDVRRFILEGKLPPKAAVRIAELMNYFPYDYEPPHTEHPVALHLEGASCPWEQSHRLVRVALKAKSYPADKIPARNLVFLIDVSASMDEPKRLPLVKSSLRLLLDRLTENDRVSIVTYAGTTSVHLQGTKGSEKRKILRAIDRLQAAGDANEGCGMALAYEEARTGFIANGVNRVVLVTDGDFNVGITSELELIKLVEQKRRTGIYLSVLGFGFGNLKDATMEKLAHFGRGHYAYIENPDQARRFFVDQNASLSVVANEVKIQVEFNPKQVESYRLIGYESRLSQSEDPKNEAKIAGDMANGQCVTALYEIVPVGASNPAPANDASKNQKDAQLAHIATNGDWLTVKVRYKNPDSAVAKEFSNVLPAFGMKLVPSTDFRFAVSVAAFGMLLRDSEFKGSANYTGVLAMARDALGDDKAGYRSEFLKLVQRAAAIEKKTPKEPATIAEKQK